MQPFTVCVRPLGSHYLVNVEGLANATWLLTQLSRHFVFRTAEPIRQDAHSSLCTFHIPYDARMPVHQLRKLLGAIPEVKLAAAEPIERAMV
jgi:hypothetical protein